MEEKGPHREGGEEKEKSDDDHVERGEQRRIKMIALIRFGEAGGNHPRSALVFVLPPRYFVYI